LGVGGVYTFLRTGLPCWELLNGRSEALHFETRR